MVEGLRRTAKTGLRKSAGLMVRVRVRYPHARDAALEFRILESADSSGRSREMEGRRSGSRLRHGRGRREWKADGQVSERGE